MSTTVEHTSLADSLKSSAHHTPRASRGGGKLLIIALAALGIGGGGYWGVDFLGAGKVASQDYVLHEVNQQEMDITVVERGSLESGKNVDLVCEVEARTPNSPATTIISIIKEGSEAKKGDLLVELDSASLKDQITQQLIKVEQARASLTKASTDLEIQKSQNESDIQTALIAVDLAEIDLRKYLEGDYKQEKRNIDGEIVIAEEELSRARDRLDYSEKLSKKGYVSSSEVDADKLAVIKSENSHNVAREKLRVLDEYTKPRTEKDLGSKHVEAKRKLDRVRNEAKAKEAQVSAAMLAQKLTTETEETTLRRLEKQLDKCNIYAPTDGMIVYANDPSASMRGQPQIQIEEGASVRERQKIIRIPDLGSMMVNVKVHEAKVSHVRPGQSARIKVESMPEKIFPATVKTVATTADSQSWFSAGVQVYTVMVSISEAVEGLKPGMTAEVEILSEKLSDVLTVPVQSVVERHGQNYVYVLASKEKTPTHRRVEVGQSNDKMVVVEKGLARGEKVIENIIAVINEESLDIVAKEDEEKHAAEKPAPSTVAQARPPGAATGNGNGNGAGPSGKTSAEGTAAGKSGGGGSFLLKQYDKNEDGKISLADEVPEERRAMLQRYDTNNDGFIDSTELAAIKPRSASGGGAGGAGGFTMPTNGAEWIKANDKNNDGKVSKDELPEFVQQFFSTMDTNGDGFVDATEAEAVVQRMKQMQQQGGAGQGGPPGGRQP